MGASGQTYGEDQSAQVDSQVWSLPQVCERLVRDQSDCDPNCCGHSNGALDQAHVDPSVAKVITKAAYHLNDMVSKCYSLSYP